MSEIRADVEPNEEEDDAVIEPQKPSEDQNNATPPKMNLGFIHAFIASFSVIIVSEIGDKTFFIACIMSMVSDMCHISNTTKR